METPTHPPRQFLSTVSVVDWGGRSTRAEVDLDAVVANVRAMRAVARSPHLMSVVKANAYGHGAVSIARAALTGGASWLGVYTVGEGVALREAGIEAPILVFGPFTASEAEAIWRSRLTPTVSSPEAGEILERSSRGGRISFHLKLDTGLTRAGVCPDEALPLMRRLATYPALVPEGIYTHFARADERDKSLTYAQLRGFLQAVDRLKEAGFEFGFKHAANSAATLDVPEAHLDMVRVGISIYGYYPSPEVSRAVPLRPALRLLSVVSRVHSCAPGTGVGYGHEFRAERACTIALVPIGYGDGLPRQLGNGRGQILIRGGFAPIVGRVSMDQITVDVTEIPGVRAGDEACLIGGRADAEQSADDVAAQAGTISYDILTGLLPRVPRLYIQEGRLSSVSD